MDEKESNIIIATDEEKDVLSQLKVIWWFLAIKNL